MTTIYRASKDTDLFIGAHFAEEYDEAAAYAANEYAGTGLNFGGQVWSLECEGEVLRCDDTTDLVDWLVDEVAAGRLKIEEGDELWAAIEVVVERENQSISYYRENAWEGAELPEYLYMDEDDQEGLAEIAAKVAGSRELYGYFEDRGYSYVFQAIEQVPEIRRHLEASEYTWIRFLEPSVGEFDCDVCTTYRYLG